jgi:ABC-2 type transport system ATP-binding protein
VSEPAVEVRGLEHRYGEHQALRGVDLEVRRGEIFALLGPNGGGKTTLFRVLSTLIPPQGGSARILGADVGREPGAVRRALGVLFQSPSLDGKLSVEENLRHQGHLFGMRGRALSERIAEMLARVRLVDRADDTVEKLSGGLRRRAELAKAMLHAPEVLLLDEPSTGLDPGARRDLRDNLERLRAERGMTVLLTTHLMPEAEWADRIAILDRGQVVARGAPEELRRGVGGDVIELRSGEPESLSRAIAERFGGEPGLVDGVLRLERPDGPEFLARLLPAFAGRIDSVSMRRPTLEDVFLSRTGHRFHEDAPRPGEEAA